MPNPSATFQVSVNGAGPVSGQGVDAPSGATLDFSGVSMVGWLQARWEIYDYPEGWATPSGWTLDANGTIYSTDFTPTQITLPSNDELWGVWMVRLLINEQVANSLEILEGLLDDSIAISLLSPSGLRSIGARETTQFTTSTTRIKGWLRSIQRLLQTLEAPKITVATTNATPAVARRWATPSNGVYSMRALVNVTKSDGTKYGEYEVKACYKKAGGTLAEAYAPVVTMNVETDAGLDVTMDMDGDDAVEMHVVGIAATNLTWSISEFALTS